jgi:hypothetical protein
MSLGVLPAIPSRIFVILCKTFLARETSFKDFCDCCRRKVAASRSAFRRGAEKAVLKPEHLISALEQLFVSGEEVYAHKDTLSDVTQI